MRRAFTWLWVLGLLSGCSQDPISPIPSVPKPFLLSSAIDPRLPAPGDESRWVTAEDHTLLGTAAPDTIATPTPAHFWNLLTVELGNKAQLSPPFFARAHAYVQVGLFDALVVAHDSRRQLPDRAVSAGVAYEVLRYLFPGNGVRIAAEASSQATIDRPAGEAKMYTGWAIGRLVGLLFVQRALQDNSDLTCPCPTPPSADSIWAGTDPLLPRCGEWKTWITTSGGEFQPEPPYVFGSPDDLREVQEVYDASRVRTPEQISIVIKWASRPPTTLWNSLLNRRIAGLDALEAARAYAYLDASMLDAFISCWNTKYVYWTARPLQRTPAIVTVVPTPNFPGYTSGHATVSGAAAKVLGEIFPAERSFFEAEADEAAISRFWGGLHFTHDNDEGLRVGRLIGARAVARLQQDPSKPATALH